MPGIIFCDNGDQSKNMFSCLTKHPPLPPPNAFCSSACFQTVTKLMEMHGDNTVEDVGMEVEREDEEEGEEVAEE